MDRFRELSGDIENLLLQAEKELPMVRSLQELEEMRRQYLGKKSPLTLILRQLGELSEEERPLLGRKLNEIKEKLTVLFGHYEKQLELKELEESLTIEKLDITLPGISPPRGHRHPINQVLSEIEQIFVSMGFKIAYGPDIETDYNNFEALNIPADHPARDMQDTFYLTGGQLLRTHTSPVQIRVMQKQKPPIAIIAPGKVYRCDADISHSPMFHQVEGLLVDRKVSFADLKGVLIKFAQEMFGQETVARFRPSYFPFTEPSAEMDIQCIFCQGAGCRVCQQTGWLEVVGCGLVHPAVFENVGINPRENCGFAFGMGVERLTMLKFGINDIRLFFEGDWRFLSQF